MSNTVKGGEGTSGDDLEIRNLIQAWHRATGAGEVEQIAKLMAEDVIFLTPERPPIRGRQAFVTGLRKLLQTHSLASRGDIRELVVSGEFAYCWTELSVTSTPRDGTPPQFRRGPTLSIFKKEVDGCWRLIRDANMLVENSAELALKVDNLERELMSDGPGG